MSKPASCDALQLNARTCIPTYFILSAICVISPFVCYLHVCSLSSMLFFSLLFLSFSFFLFFLCHAHLTLIKSGYKHPSITHPPKDVTVAAGQKAELKCEASGKPAPSFQWLKDGCIIAGSNDVTITSVNGHSTLTIKNIQAPQGGKYSCRVFSIFRCTRLDDCHATITVIG